jgi:hypothetical protein
MSGLLISCDKAIFSQGENKPAQGNYPAKSQIKVSAGKAEFYLSSENIDLTTIPELEPVSFSAVVLRVGGGKGFHVLNIGQIEVKPVAKK